MLRFMSEPHSGKGEGAVHRPVMLREVLRMLDLRPGLTVVDGTVGAGGHSRRILEQIGPEGTLVGLDRDPMMLAHAAAVLDAPNVLLRQSSYADLPQVIEELGLEPVDRILLDLGLSSDQLADASRGFSFRSAGPLDLRFDRSTGEPAWQLLQDAPEEELARIFHEWGEEPHNRRIAAEIVAARRGRPIQTSQELAALVEAALPRKPRGRTHPATQVFQALRIAVNEELKHLATALSDSLPRCLKPGGLLVVITFHSLEDRMVKQAFREEDQWQNLTPKPIPPSTAEERINPRSRSAKVRAALKK